MRPDDPPAASPSLDERDTLQRAPQAASTDPSLAGSTPLKVIARGGYVVEGHFAQGGIGRILRARDRYLGRPVALKELLVAGHGEAERRFVREALLTARLQHPGIVPIYEAGRWPSGEAFYAMKLVSGRALFDLIADTRALDERLALLPNVLAMTEAVAYAHAQGVIHRDLKPENVLVGDFGETVVIDWGLAKDLREGGDADPHEPRPFDDMSPGPGSRDPELTMQGAVMGTPSYMAPEQAEGKAVDARADVYALGAILYHLLTGAPPYDASNAMAIVVKVVTEEPVPVTVRQPGVPRDLAAILDKAMARDPAGRYPSAKELADDLRRFQTGKLVAAHHYSAGERLWRWIQRNRAALAVAAIALVIVSVVGGASIRSVIREKEAARAAEAASRLAEEQATRRADELAIEQARSLASTLPGRALDLLAGVQDRSQWRRLRMIAADADAHGVATAYLGHEAGISRVAFSPDSTLMASTSDDCTLRVWDLRGGEHRVLTGHGDQVWRVAFSPDGARLASTSKDATVRIWDPRTGALLQTLIDDAPTRALAFVDDGRRLVTSDDSGELRSWDLEGGASPLLTRCEASYFFTNGRMIGCVADDHRSVWLGDARGERAQVLDAGGRTLVASGALSADGRRMAVSGDDGGLWLWDLTYDRVRRLDAGERRLRSVAFSADGELVVAGSDDSHAYLFHAPTGERRHVLDGAGAAVIRLEFSPNGDYVVGVAPEPHIHLWSVDDGADHPLAGLSQTALAASFSPDGRRLAGVSVDGELRLWEPGELVSRRLGARSFRPARAALAPDAGFVVAGAEDGAIDLWNLGDALPRRLDAHARGVELVSIAAAADRFVTADHDGDARVWSRGGDLLFDLPSPVGAVVPRAILLTPDRRRAAAVYGREVYAWDLDDPPRARRLGAHDALPNAHELTPDGRSLVTAAPDGRVMLWDPAGGEGREIIRLVGRAVAAAVSPDGSLIAGGGDEHRIYVRELASGETWTLPTQGLEVRFIVFHPDGRRAAVVSRNNVISLWDLRGRTRERTLQGHGAAVHKVAFADGGQVIVSLGLDGELRIWDLETGESRALPTSTRIHNFSVSVDGRTILTHSVESSELRLWRDDLPRDADGFYRWLDSARRPIHGPPLPPEAAAACPSMIRADGA